MVELRMDPLAWLRKQVETADVDLLREMVRAFAETLVSSGREPPPPALLRTVRDDLPSYGSRRPALQLGLSLPLGSSPCGLASA